MGEEGATPSSSRPGSSAARNRDAAKKRSALWKKQARSFKLKDVGKKVDAVRFCAQDERFFREQADVLPLLMGFLARTKSPELVMETLSAMHTLLSQPQAPREDAVDSTAAAESSDMHAEDIHPEVNAEFMLERSMDPESGWKAGEPFVNLFVATALASEIRIKAIEVYDLLLCASVARSTTSTDACVTLIQFQSAGAPCSGLLGCLNADDSELQFAALSCLRSLLRNPPDEAFLAAFEADKGIARVLEFVLHSERRYHRPALDILESYSHFESGREYLKQNGALDALRGAIQEIQETMQTTATSITAGGIDASPLSAKNAALLCTNIAVICQVFVRVQFAQEKLKQSAGSCDHEADAATCTAVVDAMLRILKYEVEHALGSGGGGSMESPRQPAGGAVAAAAATTAAANAAALAALLPFSSDRCVAIISSIGRMVEHSESCKTHAKANGLLPVLLDCFKIKLEEHLYQVADKLLHLCVFFDDARALHSHDLSKQQQQCEIINPEVPGGPPSGGEEGKARAKRSLRVDPQILCAVATGKSESAENSHPNEEVPASLGSTTCGENPPLVTVESVISLLEASHAAGNKKLVFRHIRWLSVLVDLPENGHALGEKGIVLMLKILAETPPEETLHFAFLAKCIHGIVKQNVAALELCGNDHHDPSASFFAFLQQSSAEVYMEINEEAAVMEPTPVDDEPMKELKLLGSTDPISDEPTPDASTHTGEFIAPGEPISSLCKLEWIDEYGEESAFLPLPLTTARHDVDPFLCVAQALTGLSTAFYKWNPTSDGPISTDFSELIAHKLDHDAVGGSGKIAAAAGGAGSKKKLHAESTKPAAVGEMIFLCILEKGMLIPKLISQFAAVNAAVCVSLLELLDNVMAAPGGLKALLHLAKAELDTVTAAAAAVTGEIGEEALDASPSKTPIDEHMPSATEWPIPPEKCVNMEHTLLLLPVMSVLRSPNTSFSEIEAAIRSIAVMTSDLKPIESEAAPPLKTTASTTAIGTPVIPDLVVSESDRFVNVALGCGALVLLLSFMDHVRIPTGRDKSEDRTAKMAIQIEGLALKCVTLARTKEEAIIAEYRQKMELENPPTATSPDDASPKETPGDPELLFQNHWARQLLDRKFSVSRFGYESYSALLLASELELTTVVTALLLAGAAPDTSSSDGVTPLMTAFLIGNEEMAEALLAAGANVNAITTDGQDLCVWNCALVSPFGVQVSEMIMMAYGTSAPNETMPSMRSRIQLDSVSGSPRLLERCLRAGMDANVSNSHGDFLVHALLSKSLIRRKLRNLDVCFRYNSRANDSTNNLQEIVTALIEIYAADVNSCNHMGQTPLHLALLYGHTYIAKMLLSRGANSNVQDKHGHLPLHYACLGFCNDSDETAVDIVKLLLEHADKHPLVRGVHVDLRKHKSPEEKQALAIEKTLDDGLQSVTMPRAITLQFASVPQILNSVSVVDKLLPWHFACGACGQLTSTMCLDDDQQKRYHDNGQARADLLLYLIREFGVDVGIPACKNMSGLHFAVKTDMNGSNIPVIDVLLAHRNTPEIDRKEGYLTTLNVNAVHEHTVINCLPIIPDGTHVAVLHCGHSGAEAYVSSHTIDGKYHVLLANGDHLSNVERENLKVSGTSKSIASQNQKYLLLMESSFSALHYALQGNDDTLPIRLLSLPEVSLEPEGSDLPLLALACAAQHSPEVVQKLVNQQANMRVHLPLRTSAFEPIRTEVSSSLDSRKHETALHYAVMYEDLAVVRVLVSNPNGHVNVNVRRSGDGFTPLHLACEMGNMDIVLLLLEHGANLVQPSTTSSSVLATGVSPLHLLIRYDSLENQRLKALIEKNVVTPQMIIDNLGGVYTPRKECAEDASHEDNQVSTPKSGNKTGSDVPEDQDDARCILLDIEDENLELFERLQGLNHDQRNNQGTIIRRLETELEKSDDVLRLFFTLLNDKPGKDLTEATTERSENQQRVGMLPMLALRKLPHRHECYRHCTTRSQWKPKVGSTKLVRTGSVAKLETPKPEQAA